MNSPLSRRIAVCQHPTKLRKHKLLCNIRALQLRRIKWHETLITYAALFFLLGALLAGCTCMVTFATPTQGGLVLMALLLDIGMLYMATIGVL